MTMTNNENSPDSLEFGGEHAATPADLQTLNNHNFLIALGGVAARSNQAAAPHFAMPVSRTRGVKGDSFGWMFNRSCFSCPSSQHYSHFLRASHNFPDVMNATANSNKNNSSGGGGGREAEDEENQQSNDDAEEEEEEEEECNFPLNLVATQMGSDSSQH